MVQKYYAIHSIDLRFSLTDKDAHFEDIFMVYSVNPSRKSVTVMFFFNETPYITFLHYLLVRQKVIKNTETLFVTLSRSLWI